MGQAIRASVYRQAAIVRLAEAEYLKAAHPAGAIYLGGYVIECMLKWAICQRHGIIYLEDLPDQKLAERVTGSRGHDLNFLLESSGLQPLLKLNKPLYKSFVLVSKWNVTLRYEPQAGNAITALRFLADVRAIRNWLEQI